MAKKTPIKKPAVNKASPRRVAPQKTVSLDDACLQILHKHTGRSISPYELSHDLGQDFDLDDIAAALDRLESAGKVHSKEAKDGSGTYYWI